MRPPSSAVLSTAETRTLREVAAKLPDPSQGLPDPVFHFALAVTPMINVDLLLIDERRRILLAWRVDAWGEGWHVPGGIVRFNEPLTHRIAEVARLELGVSVRPAPTALRITEFFGGRGHFVSLLYPCALESGSFDARLISAETAPRPGDLCWFREPPPGPVYPVHKAYVSALAGSVEEAIAAVRSSPPAQE